MGLFDENEVGPPPNSDPIFVSVEVQEDKDWKQKFSNSTLTSTFLSCRPPRPLSVSQNLFRPSRIEKAKIKNYRDRGFGGTVLSHTSLSLLMQGFLWVLRP